MLEIPFYVDALFIVTVMLTYLLFWKLIKASISSKSSLIIGVIAFFWILLQSLLSYSLFYYETASQTPPPFPFMGFIPVFVFMFILFLNKKGSLFIHSLDLKKLTLMSIVRIPVEIVLWMLYLNSSIPKIMTFEGQNLDIIAGITAPIAYYIYTKTKSKNILIGWNIIGLLLLLNIVITAIFSFPTIIQKLAFDQPNIGLLYFPYFLLPAFVVPVVFFSHFASIKILRNKG